MKLIGKGGECKVWRTEDGIFKEYQTKSEAEGAYYWQWELSRWNLAPEVYTRVKRIRINGRAGIDGVSGTPISADKEADTASWGSGHCPTPFETFGLPLADDRISK